MSGPDLRYVYISRRVDEDSVEDDEDEEECDSGIKPWLVGRVKVVLLQCPFDGHHNRATIAPDHCTHLVSVTDSLTLGHTYREA